MAVAVDIGSMIVSTPGVRGGRPRIVGAGIAVHRIVRYVQMGWTIEDLLRSAPRLDRAQIHAALAYYYANKAEMDRSMAEDDEIEAQLMEEHTGTREP